jgi:hypothetical protein
VFCFVVLWLLLVCVVLLLGLVDGFRWFGCLHLGLHQLGDHLRDLVSLVALKTAHRCRARHRACRDSGKKKAKEGLVENRAKKGYGGRCVRLTKPSLEYQSIDEEGVCATDKTELGVPIY